MLGIPILQILFLFAVLLAFAETGKKRGIDSWPYIAVAFFGHVLVAQLSAILLGPGPGMILAWGWIGLVYLSMFVLGARGRRLRDSWQCPECMLFNEPTTLVCPCGCAAPELGDYESAPTNQVPTLKFGFWPVITDEESAKWSIRLGFWAAAFQAFSAVLGGVLAIAGVPAFAGNELAIASAVIYGLVAIGLAFKSRIAAVFGLVFFVSDALLLLAGLTIAILPILLVLLSIAGVRGTFRYHSYRKARWAGAAAGHTEETI